jgi:D-alanyl-D-alanine carboxypeptidase (penicillin-binding protein 5/6)
MLEPARRASFLALLASTICVVATPVLAQDPIPTVEQHLPPTSDLRVPSYEPRYAAIVIDAGTGEILYQERADSVRYPASITKIMTLYLAFEALSTGRLHETDMITVSPLAASQAPTKLGLRPGDQISVEDAMHAIAVKSANDMAVALSEKIGGTEARFAAMMTLKAQELGMTHTRYVNANGLPDTRQVTSARDIAMLCMAVLRDYPQYYHYFGTTQFTYRGVTMNNHNGLLGNLQGVDGFKTGFTSAAGFNLAASAVRDGHRIIAVELGGSSSASRNANVTNLLLTAFDIQHRRELGQNITVAQNMFDAPPAAGVISMPQAQDGQGDGDEDPIDIVLAASQSGHGQSVAFPSANVTQLAAQRPSLTADIPHAPQYATAFGAPPATAAAAPQPRNWTVQVGEFRSGRLATRQVDVVADRFKSIFDDREGQVAHIGARYYSVFTGFTQSEARAACSTLAADDKQCMAQQR